VQSEAGNGAVFRKRANMLIHRHYLSAQTAFYSLNPDRDIHGPLAINPTYMGLAANHITAQAIGYRASEEVWCAFVWYEPPILYKSTSFYFNIILLPLKYI
jgi:hypothetical protein